jgi:hypothetical protein
MPKKELFVGLVVVPAIAIVWGGYAASVLWLWFVTPLGAPAISTAHAAGLGCIISAFLGSRGTYHGEHEGKEAGELMATAVGRVIVGPLVLLFFGWLIRPWM